MPLTSGQKEHLRSLYAGRHKMFFLENYPAAYATMQKKGELESYFEEIGKQATAMYETLEDQMKAKAEEIANPAEKMNYINHIPLVVEEMVRNDIVYAKL